jgi:hypothetical protein
VTQRQLSRVYAPLVTPEIERRSPQRNSQLGELRSSENGPVRSATFRPVVAVTCALLRNSDYLLPTLGFPPRVAPGSVANNRHHRRNTSRIGHR